VLGFLLTRRIIRHRGSCDEIIEVVDAQEPVRVGRNEAIATGQCGTSHTETVDQEQHQRSGCPSRKSLETPGPGHSFTIEREIPRLRQPIANRVFEMSDFEIDDVVGILLR
jgi:hypothetical protein